MFFFKSKKPILKDLIPQDYVDIHSHLIPAIDDGSKSIDETFSMINQLLEIGFKEIITTPRNEMVVNVGENIAGFLEIKGNAHKGERILLEYSEVLDRDGNFIHNIAGQNKNQTDVRR